MKDFAEQQRALLKSISDCLERNRRLAVEREARERREREERERQEQVERIAREVNLLFTERCG